MAMEIFRLVGSVFVDTADAEKSLQKTDEKTEGIGKKLLSGIGTAAKWGAGLAAAAGTCATALYGVATKSAEAMDAIDKGAAKVGISKTAYQEWSYVLGQNGMDIDKLETGMKSLLSSMDGAAAGTASAQERFDALGLSIYDANGNLKDQETMLQETLYALADMENGTEKARLATELFGKAGVEMMPMLNGGSEGMAELTARAHELGLVVSDEAVTAGVVLGDTLDDVKRSFTMVINKIGVELMPLIQSALDWVLEHMPEIQSIVGGVFDVISGVVTTAGEVFQTILGAIDTAMTSSGVLWSDVLSAMQTAFKTAMSVIKSVWQNIGKPVWGLIKTVVGTVADYFSDKMPEIRDFVKTTFTDIKNLWEQHLKPTFTAVGNFIQNVLAPAFKLVFNTIIGPTVSTAFHTIKQLWIGTLKPVFQGILDFITGVFSLNFKQAFSGLVTAIGGIWNGLETVVKTPINAVIGIINGFTGGLNKLKIPDWVPGVGGKGINISTIPYLEQGAVLEKGQVGFLEGHGAEAVVPLHENKKWISAVARDMESSGAGGSGTSSELLDAFEEFVDALPGLLLEAFSNMRFDINDREFARMVRKV